MHIIHLIQRRFPQRAAGLTFTLVVLSASALLAGVGLLLMQTAGR